MIETDPQLGTFNITARLLKLVNDMPKDQQLILLKQLIGENVTKHLFKLIVEMSEDQQIILLEQMGIAGVTRLAVVTGYGAGRSKIAMSLIERTGFQMVFRKPYQDKDRQEAMILESDTNWTIARPGMLTNGAPSGKYKILRSPEEWRLGMISRRDVASYLIDAIEEGSELKSDVVLVR